jgi:adenylate kinase family enzyme
MVIGSGGAGKSTFARCLAELTGLPLVHLDALYWRPGWQPTTDANWDRVVEELVARDSWILDGNYGRTLPRRVAASDTIIFLDLPRLVCMWRLLRRRLQYRRQRRPELPTGCEEKLSWEFLYWVWTYPTRRRPGILRQLAAVRDQKRVVILRTRGDVDRFLATVSSDRLS